MTPTLLVTSPSGLQSRVRLENVPFCIGRLGENDLVLRDSRISRHHAQIVSDSHGFAIQDLNSRYGVYVNGERVERKLLRDSDRIHFGFPDSYQITFRIEPESQPAAQAKTGRLGGQNLSKLRAMLEVARALQSSLSIDEVLAAVVEAALAITGCERGFLLLLRDHGDLEIRVGRDRNGPLPQDELKVPVRLLLRALKQRKDFLHIDFDALSGAGEDAGRTIAALELRTVVCLPLVKVRTGSVQETTTISPMDDTVGLLYMDSRAGSADLSSGGRELLTTLALEASTVLENARLLEEQWARQRMEQELRIARRIQQSLLPRSLPSSGWFRAAASSLPSLQVGGDYLDVRQMAPELWSAVIADVSGKGVGAALLASLLQGIFLAAPYTRITIEESMGRINRFLNERTGGEQYATLFFCTIGPGGTVNWTNAGHLPPLVVRPNGELAPLEANGLPLGMLEEAAFRAEQIQLRPGDKLVLFTDGVTEAQNAAREFFGIERLRSVAAANASADCRQTHAAILSELERFTQGALQNDDVTLAVLEYSGS